jgi:hypothetical protein
MKRCAESGWIVGMTTPIPDDPRVAYDGSPALMGCSHIVCTDCGQAVRRVDRRRVPQLYPVPAQLQALYDAPDPDQLGVFVSKLSDGHRAYFCRCSWTDQFAGSPLRWSDLPWKCGGHPD